MLVRAACPRKVEPLRQEVRIRIRFAAVAGIISPTENSRLARKLILFALSA